MTVRRTAQTMNGARAAAIIFTSIDTYGHLLLVGDELISEIIDTALGGQQIRPAPLMLLVAGSQA